MSGETRRRGFSSDPIAADDIESEHTVKTEAVVDATLSDSANVTDDIVTAESEIESAEFEPLIDYSAGVSGVTRRDTARIRTDDQVETEPEAKPYKLGDPSSKRTKYGLLKREYLPRPEATRVSAEELEQRFEAKKALRREQREAKRAAWTPERRRARRQKIIIGTVLGAAVIAGGFGSTVLSNNQTKAAANTATITDLQKQLTQAQADAEVKAEVVTTDTATAVNTAAADLASQVAAAQNRFSELYAAISADETPGNGAPSDLMYAEVDHRKDLASFFNESTYLVDDETAYTFTTEDVYNTSTGIDPRFAWYVAYDGLDAWDASRYNWTVSSVTPDLEDVTKADVVWSCADTDGTVLAWATSQYSQDTGRFGQLSLVTTSAGASHALDVAGDLTDTGVDVPELDDVTGE